MPSWRPAAFWTSFCKDRPHNLRHARCQVSIARLYKFSSLVSFRVSISHVFLVDSVNNYLCESLSPSAACSSFLLLFFSSRVLCGFPYCQQLGGSYRICVVCQRVSSFRFRGYEVKDLLQDVWVCCTLYRSDNTSYRGERVSSACACLISLELQLPVRTSGSFDIISFVDVKLSATKTVIKSPRTNIARLLLIKVFVTVFVE